MNNSETHFSFGTEFGSQQQEWIKNLKAKS
jgi:hypothetical protein